MKLEVQITPNAGKSEIVGWHGGRLKIKIKAPAVEGKANEELVKFLANQLGLHRRNVTIARGESSRAKLLEITGLDDEEIQSKLGISFPEAE